MQPRNAKIATLVASAILVVAACSGRRQWRPGGTSGAAEKFDVGVSNTLQGNGWREQMICSINAEATKSARSRRSRR